MPWPAVLDDWTDCIPGSKSTGTDAAGLSPALIGEVLLIRFYLFQRSYSAPIVVLRRAFGDKAGELAPCIRTCYFDGLGDQPPLDDRASGV